MSSLPWNTATSSTPDYLPHASAERKAAILNYVSSHKHLIDVRPASLLEVRPRPEMISTGVAELDAMTGGLPCGCLSEICGPGSSGKTSMLLATIAAATRRDESCALIDSGDSFDPESGTAAGINFGKFFWVRCGKKSSVFGRQASAKNIGADGRQPFLACPEKRSAEGTHDNFVSKTYSERRLEQVLKTTDLILQSGGFGLVALDLAGIPEKFVRRIPLASWFRFQRAVEHTKTALLVVSEFACAQTCACVVIKLSAISYQPSAKAAHSQNLGCPTLVVPSFGEIGWKYLPQEPTHAKLLERIQIEAELARTRLERKPMQSVHASFTTRAVRAG